MKNRKARLEIIIDILNGNVIGSQEELLKQLAIRGIVVTQATLSRDLKKLKTTKIASDIGGYRYVVNNADIFRGEPNIKARTTEQSPHHPAALSLDIAGNVMVIKTRTGYASGLAYDLDCLNSEHILGTISGADTVFAVCRETSNRSEIFDLMRGFLPIEIIKEASPKFIDE